MAERARNGSRRLEVESTAQLLYLLAHARTRLQFGQTPYTRDEALRDIATLKNELTRRGVDPV